MKRRDFLKNSSSGVLLPFLLQGLPIRAMAGTPLLHKLQPYMDDDRVLVLVQLSGGNDGLNTVIPLDQYAAYHSARGNIALAENKVLKLAGAPWAGLHPAMIQLQQLIQEGRAGVIQSVGYPKPNFSHFRATDIWMTAADSDKILSTGWAGRYLDLVFPDFPQNYPRRGMPDPLAIQIGSVVSPTFQGPAFMMGLAISNPSSFYTLIDDKPEIDVNTRWGEQLAYIETMSIKTDQYAAVIKAAALKVSKQSDQYPAKNPLADQLKIVARLIAGGLKTKIYMVNTGSFDTHARQTDTSDTTTGAHAALLKRVSESIAAFMVDLDQLGVGNQVMGITFSEFGRRIKSNASGGTDHGAAAPMLCFGNQLKSSILGSSPILPASATANDNIAMQFDFRSVYATLLQNWLLLDPADVQKVLGGKFALLPLV
jgi:uncharacterized protein (DUF1501 family)